VIERDDDEESIHNTNDKNNNHTSGKGVVFLLWGKPASVKAQTVLASYSKKDSKHAIIMSSHPSPLGATKTSSPFLGSKCFSRANEELVKRGWDPVDWRVDGGL
jgi:uracil-DNA glycosylase